MTVDQQVRRFDEVRLLRDLFDWDSAITKNALVAVDKGNGAGGRPRIPERRIEGDESSLAPKIRDVDRPLAFGSFDHFQFNGLPVVRERCGIGTHSTRSPKQPKSDAD